MKASMCELILIRILPAGNGMPPVAHDFLSAYGAIVNQKSDQKPVEWRLQQVGRMIALGQLWNFLLGLLT